jgi:hypothetical protein
MWRPEIGDILYLFDLSDRMFLTLNAASLKARLALPVAALPSPVTSGRPTAAINSANRSWEWLGRLSGAYAFPYGIQASPNLEMRSGAAQARQVLLVGGIGVPSLLVNAEPLEPARYRLFAACVCVPKRALP